MAVPARKLLDPAVSTADSSPVPSGRLRMGRSTTGPGYSIRRDDGIPEWLLVWTESGRGRFGSAGRPDVIAAPGTLTALLPGTAHDYGLAPDAQQWVLWWAHVRPRPDWEPLLDWPEPAPGVRQTRFGPGARHRVQDALDGSLDSYRGTTAVAELAALNGLETALLRCGLPGAVGAPLDERVEAVLDHIHADLRADLRVPALARVATLSASRLAHLFRDEVGTSPARFVEAARMAAAQDLLTRSATGIAAVGRDVGYEDPLHFSARFRALTGLSPRAYRSRHRISDRVPDPLVGARLSVPDRAVREAEQRGTGVDTPRPRGHDPNP